MSDGQAAGRPWHLWVVGLLSLLWNSVGCIDYTMTELHNDAYFAMGGFTPEQIAWFTSFPAWAIAFWAVGVWGALTGSILLLLRSRHAIVAFALSLIGLAVGTIYQFGIGDMPASLNTPGTQALTTGLWVIAIFLLWYAMRMKARGVLR